MGSLQLVSSWDNITLLVVENCFISASTLISAAKLDPKFSIWRELESMKPFLCFFSFTVESTEISNFFFSQVPFTTVNANIEHNTLVINNSRLKSNRDSLSLFIGLTRYKDLIVIRSDNRINVFYIAPIKNPALVNDNDRWI